VLPFGNDASSVLQNKVGMAGIVYGGVCFTSGTTPLETVKTFPSSTTAALFKKS